MSSPPPDGLTARPLRLDDAATIAEIANEDERSFGVDGVLGAQDVTEWLMRVDLDASSWLLESGREPVAFGWMEVHGEDVVAVGGVRPGHKGRGLGEWLVRRSEEQARSLSRSIVHQIVLGPDLTAHALLDALGYQQVRRHWEMVIELDVDPPAPTLPDDLRIETFREEDARSFHAASGEAFQDEWGFHPMLFDEWWRMRTRDPGYDPTLWFVIRDGSEIAAVARCVDGLRSGGHVGMLGVRAPWRRRGLGLALLLHAFAEFRKRGAPHVSLGVDSENPTGATRLYEKAGMHVEREYVTFERTLA
jgi:mycothiol synthase